MGWQGTLVLTLWLPKVLGLSPAKAFFPLPVPSPPITRQWRGAIVQWREGVVPSPCCKHHPLLRNCHFSECMSTTVSQAALRLARLNEPKLLSYIDQTLCFSSASFFSSISTFLQMELTKQSPAPHSTEPSFCQSNRYSRFVCGLMMGAHMYFFVCR